MSNLLRQQYRKIDNQDYKFELLSLAFENDKLIERSLFFIEQTIRIPFPILKVKTKKDEKLPNRNTFFTKEDCERHFLGFINLKKDDKIYCFYEKINNETFVQVLLYYFEMVTFNYFNEILNKYKNNKPDPQNPNIKSDKECNELILNQNLLFLNKSLKHLDDVSNNENLNEGALNNLGKIYSIAYIKLFIKFLAEIYRFNKNKISFQPIIDVISSRECNTRKVVKIFFFKNFLQYFENYSLFNDYIFKDKEFPFRKEYIEIIEKQNCKINYILSNHFVVMKEFEENHLKSIIPFISLKDNNFKNLNSFLTKEFINKKGLDLFYSLLVNHLLSYFYSNEKEESNRKIESLKNEFNKISNNLNLSQTTLNLLNKLFNFSEFINIVISKQDNNNQFTQEQFEILMHSLRFVLQTAQNKNNNNFYLNLLLQQCKEYIKNNYIIGTLPYNNIFLKSYYSLNTLMRAPTPIPTGYYVCTCGQYYTLGNCTCPAQTFDCYNKNCKLKISGTGHKLLGPEAGQTDHWRVILKEEDKNVTSYSSREIAAGKIPCIFLDEFKRRYVDRFINEQPKGIKKEDTEDFIERKDNVRTMDEISFRLLNFILYSHLFVSNILGNINDEEMRNYTHGTFTCLRLIEKNWEIIETILNEKGINNIKIFMNIIFDKLSVLLNSIEDMSTIEKRQEFETSIKNYIEQVINNKNEYELEENNYNSYNEKIKGGNPENFVEILLENYSPGNGNNLYAEYDYPNLELFIISKYPDINELERCLSMQPDYTTNYCLLNQVLICNEEYGLIENVVNINKLVDLLYKKYNNKIERDTAKTKKIIDCFEDENIDDIKQNILQPYIDSWNKIKSKCTKYLCRPDMPELNITMNHTLIHFLPDDGELYGGMYLASAYRNLIDWQNSFVKIILDSIGPNSLLRSYLSQLSQEIPIQEANEEDVVNINENTVQKVKAMINQYSMRDIFKNGKIDFKEFKKSIKFDFDSIENELARQILPGVKQFISLEANEPIKFVTYLYETFRSSRSSIITNYNNKYPARDLTYNEEELLYSFIESKKKTKQNFSKDILSSCQILIDYIQKENFNKNEAIYSVVRKLPEYIEIDELLKSFFIENSNDIKIKEENTQMFSVNTLINIYNLIELICWEQFKDNLNDQYKMHLSEENKNKIKNYFDSNILQNNLIKKNDVASAVRRLISRYLSGKRGDTDISEFKILFDYIQRADLWRTELQDNDSFATEIYTIFEGIKREINLVIKCNDDDNKCKLCEDKKFEGQQNPCNECEKCNSGLRIGHALEFYELINDEIIDLNKFKKKETMDDLSDDEKDNDNIVKERKKNKNKNENQIIENENEEEINTNSHKEENEEKGEQNFDEAQKEEEEASHEEQENIYEEDEEDDLGEI